MRWDFRRVDQGRGKFRLTTTMRDSKCEWGYQGSEVEGSWRGGGLIIMCLSSFGDSLLLVYYQKLNLGMRIHGFEGGMFAAYLNECMIDNDTWYGWHLGFEPGIWNLELESLGAVLC